MRSDRRAIVIGAGVSGLVAAARLAHLGYRTTVFEKDVAPGGRARQRSWNGFQFDCGPTLLFMLDVFREAFASWGDSFDTQVPVIRLTPNYRMQFADGRELVVSTVLAETMESLEVLRPGSSRHFLAYLAQSARSYEIAMSELVRVDRDLSFFTPVKLRALWASGAFGRLAHAARRSFGSDDIASAFSFQSMYLGMSPFDSPALYRLLCYTELGQGIYFPRGGIGALVRALERAAIRNGATFHYGVEVDEIVRATDTVDGVRVGGEVREADVVVVTADLSYAYRSLLRDSSHRSLRMRHTPSALLIYAGLSQAYPDLHHHEFLMPSSLRTACSAIFREERIPADPAIYLAAPARTDASFAPAGGEALYILVPVPNLRGSVEWASQTEAIVQEIFERIERRRLPGLRDRIVFYKTQTPVDFATERNLNEGAAFGLSHDLLQIGPMRPPNRHRRYRNLYFAGASTRPATGLPLVTMSAMQTVDRIAREAAHG